MKTYLAVFTGTQDAMAQWKSLDEATRQQREKAGIAAWHQWMEDNGAAVVDTGGPLGKTKRISKRGIEDVSNNLSAFVTLKAESQEAAAKLFENHPHFSIFPGDGVEVMEVLPIPQRGG